MQSEVALSFMRERQTQTQRCDINKGERYNVKVTLDALVKDIREGGGVPLGLLVFVNQECTHSLVEILLLHDPLGQTEFHLEALSKIEGLAAADLAEGDLEACWRHLHESLQDPRGRRVSLSLESLYNFLNRGLGEAAVNDLPPGSQGKGSTRVL